MITGYDIRNVMNRTYGWPDDVLDGHETTAGGRRMPGLRRLATLVRGRRSS